MEKIKKMSIFAVKSGNRADIAKQNINNVKPANIVLLILLSLPFITFAQSGESAFNFLRLPQSAHAAALGGDNISVIDDDITLSAATLLSLM